MNKVCTLRIALVKYNVLTLEYTLIVKNPYHTQIEQEGLPHRSNRWDNELENIDDESQEEGEDEQAQPSGGLLEIREQIADDMWQDYQAYRGRHGLH